MGDLINFLTGMTVMRMFMAPLSLSLSKDDSLGKRIRWAGRLVENEEIISAGYN